MLRAYLLALAHPAMSTPITDIIEPYGDIVYMGGTPEEFVAACEAAVGAWADERWMRIEAGHQVVARTSWAGTVRAMESLLDEAAMRGQTRAAAASFAAYGPLLSV